MNQELTNRIENYLELDTNYAVIINGNYGIGKTYYIKNSLFPSITSKGKFTPILISLFGIKSVEEIQKQIFVELYPILKKKGVKIAAGLGKSIFKFLSNTDIEQLLIDTETTSGDLIDYGKILLCIDDIDRKSKDLDIKEFFGFINNLVENLNTKIIIILNENELLKDKHLNDNDYSLLKEKVIGTSINFNSNILKIYDEIIKSKYKTENTEYYDFLVKYKGNIIKRIEQNSNNLRNLLFFLEHFKIIYFQLIKKLKENPSLKKNQKEILEIILKFSLPIAIEYKIGKLNKTNFETIKGFYLGTNIDLAVLLSISESEKPKEKSYLDTFKEKYINDYERKYYFESIFNYLTGNTSFNINELENELVLIFGIENNNISKTDWILKQLSYWNCLDIKFSEYKSFTKNMLEYVDSGEYSLEQYLTVFHYATRFDNPLNYNVVKLIKRFKKGIEKGKSKYKYDGSLDIKLSVDTNSEFSDELKEIADFCININRQLYDAENKKKILNLFEIYKSDFNTFIEHIRNPNSESFYKPIFAEFNFNQFWKYFRKLHNSQIIDLSFYFKNRYNRHSLQELLPEKEFLEKFRTKLEESIKSTKKPKKIAYELLLSKIKDSVKSFDNNEY